MIINFKTRTIKDRRIKCGAGTKSPPKNLTANGFLSVPYLYQSAAHESSAGEVVSDV